MARPLSRTTGDGSDEFISARQSVHTYDITNKIKDLVWPEPEGLRGFDVLINGVKQSRAGRAERGRTEKSTAASGQSARKSEAARRHIALLAAQTADDTVMILMS